MGGTVDLFAAAAANAGSLNTRLESLLGGLPPAEQDTVKRFVDVVQQHGRISINMQLTAINHMLVFGAHQNVYEWAADQSDLSGRPRDDIIRERLGPWFGPRTAFDSQFADGQDFRYGALNIGGPGAAKYGEVCVVLKADFPANEARIAYLRDDSLTLCTLAGGAVDGSRACAGAASGTHRGALAGLKHATDVCACPDHEWPVKLCSDAVCIEAVFVEKPTPDSVQSARMSGTGLARLRGLAYDDYRQKLSVESKGYAGQFAILCRLLRQRTIPLESV